MITFNRKLLLLLLAVVCMSMTQCPKCIKGNLAIDNETRTWLPYRGVDSVKFVTAGGAEKKFRCYFVDTARTYRNFDCDDFYSADSVGFSLEIAPADSLFMRIDLASPNYMYLGVRSRTAAYIGVGNVLYGPEGTARKRYSSLTLNGFTYGDSRLVYVYMPNNPLMDSIYLSRNYGVVSFKYNHISYYLK